LADHIKADDFTTPSISNGSRGRPRVSTLRSRCVVYLFILDIGCIFLGFLIASTVREIFLSATDWLEPFLVTSPIYAVTAFALHAYSRKVLQDPFFAIRRGVQATATSLVAVIFIAFAFRVSDNFPRLLMLIGALSSVSLIAFARYHFVRYLRAIMGGDPFNVLLICDDGGEIPSGNYSIMRSAELGLDPDARDPMMFDRLAKLLQGADRVVVSCSPERRMAWSHALKGTAIQGEIIVPELSVLKPLGVAHHGALPTVVVAVGALGWFDRLLKRVFDIVAASAAIVLLSPLLIMIAVAVKLDSSGPVFFKQSRIGRGNEMFEILKFRSMQAELSDKDGDQSTKRNDHRITRVGRLLRLSSLDELPQLFNVLRGEMSIVGPRPHAVGSRAAAKLFWDIDPRYWHRHVIKPGLTGLAQIRGFRGATLKEADLINRLQADFEYLENWSIWRDIKIIFLTVRVLFHRNAF